MSTTMCSGARTEKSLPVEYVACPLVENGHVDGIVVAFTDVTDRRRLDRMKDEFIATVSHELRTPLTSLRAALGLVASGALDKRPEKVRAHAGYRAGQLRSAGSSGQ